MTGVGNQDAELVGNPVASSFQELLEKNRVFEADIQSLRERLQMAEAGRERAEQREEWLRNHVDKLTDENARLLPSPTQPKTSWMKRIFG